MWRNNPLAKKECSGSTSFSRMHQSQTTCFIKTHFPNAIIPMMDPTPEKVYPGSSMINRSWYSPFGYSFHSVIFIWEIHVVGIDTFGKKCSVNVHTLELKPFSLRASQLLHSIFNI